MEKRLRGLTCGHSGVITRVKKAPRLQTLGFAPGAVVCCKYKSNRIMVLEIGERLIALPIFQLRGVWADY